MTVLPDRACLRRYALPAHFLAELGRVTEAGALLPLASAPRHPQAAPHGCVEADARRVAGRIETDKPSA